MRIVSRDEMKEIDRITVQEYQISDELLMENAGVEFVNALFQDRALGPGTRVAVLCGGGNNGGDGFVIARHLERRGYEARVYTFVDRGKYDGPALSNLRRLDHFGMVVTELLTREALEKEVPTLRGFDLFIDALLGIGFRGSPRGVIADAIDFINASGVPVYAVDLPSGVDADGGQTELRAVRALATYTIGALKFGLVEFPGKEFGGRVRVLDIGFPPEALRRANPFANFIDRELAAQILPERKSDSHKGSYGHLAVVGGSSGYSGAPIMAAKAASRGGCGLVSVLFPPGASYTKPDEVIALAYPLGDKGFPEGFDGEGFFSRFSAVVVGPGMGISGAGAVIVGDLLRLGKRILVDADGLTNLSRDLSALDGAKGDVVLTPHVGEMSRLCGKSKEEIKLGARGAARDFARRHGVTLVLKDSVTLVASKEGALYINDGGVPALAKGGSGDVLSGIIGSLMARGLSGLDAAVLGVYLHTECGRLAERTLHPEAVKAGDLIELLPRAFRTLTCRRL
jgi:NAD(P)H-hydrate epimerase